MRLHRVLSLIFCVHELKRAAGMLGDDELDELIKASDKSGRYKETF